MATLISAGNINFSSSSWRTIETEISVTTLTTNFATVAGVTTTTSLVFSPSLASSSNTNVVDGVMLYVKRNSGATGTFSCGLSSNGSSNISGTLVTVNVTDIPLVPTMMFFAFGTPVTLSNVLSYSVSVVSSVAATVTVYRSTTTTSDWFRLLRRNSSGTASAAAGDVTFITGDYTAAATFSAWTVTMDVTTATATNFGAFVVGNQGTLQWGSTGNTNYRLRIASGAQCLVFGGGTLNMGTSGSPIPAYTTATLDFESASASAAGLEVRGGTLSTYGSQLKQAWVTNVLGSGTTATLTTATSHGFATNESVVISGLTHTGFNGTYIVASTPSTTTFTYANATSQSTIADTGIASIQVSISNKALSGNVATLTTSQAHGFVAGEYVVIAGVDVALNGTYQILYVPGTTSFVYGLTTNRQQNVITKALTSNIATLTTASYHTFNVGDSVVVNGVDSTFNGVYTIASVPTTTSFTYGLTSGNVSPTAATGTATDVPPLQVVNKSLTSNVATLTTITPHGFGVGASVTVAGLESPFNGTATISSIPTIGVAPSLMQFNYSATGTNVPSTPTFNNVGTVNLTNLSSTSATGTATITKATLAYLAADRSSGAATITTSIPTNWIAGTTVSTGQNLLGNGDSLAIASTSVTSGQSEAFKAISTISGTAITLSSNAASNHSGTVNTNQDTRAEVINLTRNVKITGAVANTVGTASGTTAYLFCDESATATCFFTEFEWFGGAAAGTAGLFPAVAGKTGIALRASPSAGPLVGSSVFFGCSTHDGSGGSAFGFNLETNEVTGAIVDGINVQSCVGYNYGAAFFFQDAANNAGLKIYVDGCCSIRCGNSVGAAGLVQSADAGLNVTNCNACAGNVGFTMSELLSTAAYNGAGIWANIVAHSSDGAGFNITGAQAVNLNVYNAKIWRNAGTGVLTGALFDSLFDSLQAWGNNTTGISIDSPSNNVTFKNVTADFGGTQFAVAGAQTTGMAFPSTGAYSNVFLLNSTFGTNQNHTAADLAPVNNALGFVLLCNNVTLSSTTAISNFTYSNTTNFRSGNKIGFTRYNQTAGSHRTVYLYGLVTSDNTFFKTAAPSEKLLPTNCTTAYRLKMESSPKRAALASGNNTTASVWVRQSVLADGGAYNGNFPQLVLKANPGAGILTDQILATGTAAGQGAFEQLSGLTPTVTDDAVLEFVVQVNGTAGFCSIDDWSVT